MAKYPPSKKADNSRLKSETNKGFHASIQIVFNDSNKSLYERIDKAAQKKGLTNAGFLKMLAAEHCEANNIK